LSHGGAAVVTPNQESVKEIQISSSSYSAEDGRNSGAQIKVVSQNGTNDFHGSAIFKYNTPEWNAFNKYPNDLDAGAPRESSAFPPVWRQSRWSTLSAATLVKADRQFIAARIEVLLFSYEGLRENSSTPVYVR
jgi:hypothetical protein